MNVVIRTFYKFVKLDDFTWLKDPLKAVCARHGVKGSILLAAEGINGTIAGSVEGVTAVFAHLRSDPRLADLSYKESFADEIPFYRMKVRLKKEIVKLGLPDVDPTQKVGTYVKPEAWNELISNPDVLLIDTRNSFEVDVGTFKGAVNPHTKSFGEFPDYVEKALDPNRHKKIAMFCTGGIRCEKATSLLLAQGFEEVYHLQGGILKYLEAVPEEESLWQGQCFVFDNRVTVEHDLKPGDYVLCYGCKQPVSPEEMASEKYEEGVSCPRCFDELTAERRASLEERQKQVKLAEERGEVHIGRPFK